MHAARPPYDVSHESPDPIYTLNPSPFVHDIVYTHSNTSLGVGVAWKVEVKRGGVVRLQ
jgi:hypothetical protein